MSSDWKDVGKPSSSAASLSAALVATGPVIPPQQRLLSYSPDEWESFVEEWAYYCLKKIYQHVQRFSGSGDMGIDIAGFADARRLAGVWDNYQCKHKDHALAPSEVWAEFGKILWYSFKGEYSAPRRYYFVAPWGAGTKLSRLLADASRLRDELIENWDKHVKSAITETQDVPLDAKFRDYVLDFDFTIFDAKTALQLVSDHQVSPVHAARFGGGLPPRPAAATPPVGVTPAESRYVKQLLGAYGEHAKSIVSDPSEMPPKLKGHFHRQREAFFSAESLKIFARDTVPPGTFESLQNDIYDGVIDTHDEVYADGYQKICAVTRASQELQITANALISCTDPRDRHGICHQLVNDERLWWKK